MTLDPNRLSRIELKDLLVKYEKAVEEDAFNLLRPTQFERQLLGDELIDARREAVRQARDTNRRFVECVIEDLPDFCAAPVGDVLPHRPIAELCCPRDELAPPLQANSYGSLASVFLHLLRDWSSECDHVFQSTYGPAIEVLLKHAPKNCNVLLPGAGLGRLALELSSRGYCVEANDASRLFLTFADYILNRSPAGGASIYPLAHVFSENWDHEQQYLQIKVPTPTPREVLARCGDGALPGGDVETSGDDSMGAQPENGARPAVSLVPGDFVKMYGTGCSNYRRFDAIVTCFFIDTSFDVAGLFSVLDGLLGEGGVWVNVGPLNWRKEARLKLSWSEVVKIWEGMGYEFVEQHRADCDYHLPRGLKMYTESYNCALTAAVKRRRS